MLKPDAAVAATGTAIDSPSGGQSVIIGLTLLALLLVLLMPGHPRDYSATAFLRLPLELPLIALALMWSPLPVSRVLRVLLVASLCLLVLLRVADIGSYLAFNRRFNPLVELHLLGDGWNLASQSIGLVEAGVGIVIALLTILLLCVLLFRGLGRIARLREGARRRLSMFCFALIITALTLLTAAKVLERPMPAQARLVPELIERWQDMRLSVADLTQFNRDLRIDPATTGQMPGFDALAGRDVVILFVESYGRSYLDGDGFADAALGELLKAEATIKGAGLSVKSGWVDSPIRGGRSWLAHGTLMSGLKIDSQARFDRLVASDRISLNRLFGDAGWQTAGLMPAIQLDWPEGRWYGYDETLDASGLGYKGEKFGWVTMPDQYTLSAFENNVRRPADVPVMAEIALISSHAPWTPLPTQVLPWPSIGDGSLFDGRFQAGPTSAEVWSDREVVRRQYAASMDYMLELIASYLAEYGNDALFLILGDHQPAAIVNGWDANAHVPLHIVADDAELLERLPSEFFTEGMLPAPAKQAQPMESIRQSLPAWFGP